MLNLSTSSPPFDPSQLLEAERRIASEIARRNEIARLEASLIDFVRAAWPSIDPTPFQESWAIEALCEHLQAVTDGEIPRLLINFPPRCGKTNVASVCWPAWTWARQERSYLSGPSVQFLCGSYNHDLSLSISNATRRLILSPWYQERWGKRFSFRDDQNTKGRFDNTEGGSRIATSVGGSLLGIGGSAILIDDPHNTESVESDADRQKVAEWWREISSTRLNDPKRSAIVVIMQRLHVEDISGLIEKSPEYEDWQHLVLPMRYDPLRHCVTQIGDRTWEDPRTEEGELLWPERFGEQEVAALETALGPYMAAGRLQQTPVPKGGAILREEWWRPWGKPEATAAGLEWNEAPKGLRQFPAFEFVIASLDTAYTEKQENDPSALTVWGLYRDSVGNRKVMLVYAWSERLELHTLVERVATTCRKYKADRLLIEAKAAGHSVAQEIQRLHARERWGVQLINPGSGDKVARAHSVVNFFAEGMICAPDTQWAQGVINECAAFPKGAHDDRVDSTTQAIRWLRDNGLLERNAEIAGVVEDSMKHRPKLDPLYPGC